MLLTLLTILNLPPLPAKNQAVLIHHGLLQVLMNERIGLFQVFLESRKNGPIDLTAILMRDSGKLQGTAQMFRCPLKIGHKRLLPLIRSNGFRPLDRIIFLSEQFPLCKGLQRGFCHCHGFVPVS